MPQPDLAKIIEEMEMTRSQVAREARTSGEELQRAIDGEVPDLKIQLKLEAVLDRPLWSTPEQFLERRKLRRFVGAEPHILTTKQLVARARQLGVDTGSLGQATKDALIDGLVKLVNSLGDNLDLNCGGRLLCCRKCGLTFEARNRSEDFCPGCCSFQICNVGG